MSDLWKPWQMSRCDCESEEHSYFCIYHNQEEPVLKIGTEKVRPVRETKRGN